MDLKKLLNQSIDAARRLKNLCLLFALAQVVFLVFGHWMVAAGYEGALSLRSEQLKYIQELGYLKPITGVLAGSLILKIFYTFVFNLIAGALVSTTVTGVIFFIPYLVAVWRSFLIGLLFYGFDLSPLMMAVFYGTFLLEFGAYSLSSAIGTDIGLAIIWPERKGNLTRKQAVGQSIRNGINLYVLVIILLFLGAVWEMSMLHYFGPLVSPEALK
ncbi:MAG: hypothetical protein AABY45_09295 [Deltaproteobacteria bacterium]